IGAIHADNPVWLQVATIESQRDKLLKRHPAAHGQIQHRVAMRGLTFIQERLQATGNGGCTRRGPHAPGGRSASKDDNPFVGRLGTLSCKIKFLSCGKSKSIVGDLRFDFLLMISINPAKTTSWVVRIGEHDVWGERLPLDRTRQVPWLICGEPRPNFNDRQKA